MAKNNSPEKIVQWIKIIQEETLIRKYFSCGFRQLLDDFSVLFSLPAGDEQSADSFVDQN